MAANLANDVIDLISKNAAPGSDAALSFIFNSKLNGSRRYFSNDLPVHDIWCMYDICYDICMMVCMIACIYGCM